MSECSLRRRGASDRDRDRASDGDRDRDRASAEGRAATPRPVRPPSALQPAPRSPAPPPTRAGPQTRGWGAGRLRRKAEQARDRRRTRRAVAKAATPQLGDTVKSPPSAGFLGTGGRAGARGPGSGDAAPRPRPAPAALVGTRRGTATRGALRRVLPPVSRQQMSPGSPGTRPAGALSPP